MAKTNDTPDTNTDLPVPVDTTRPYIQVTPTEEPLNPSSLETPFRRLNQLDLKPSQSITTKLKNALWRKPGHQPPTIECRIVSDGGEDATLRYLFGIDDEDSRDALKRILRSIFPKHYELEETNRPPNPFPTDYTTNQSDDTTDLAAVEFLGTAKRNTDWMTQLTPFEKFHDEREDTTSAPLAAIAETIASQDCPIVYQALLRPKPDWTAIAEDRIHDIEIHQDTLAGKFLSGTWDPDGDPELTSANQRRIEEIRERDTKYSFVCNARIVAIGTEHTPAERTARELRSTFAGVSKKTHEITATVATGADARTILEHVHERTFHPQNYVRTYTKIPTTTNRSRGIVVDTDEAPSFCLVDGAALTAAGARAVAPTPGERTALPRPPDDILDTYRTDGMTLGRPLTQDGRPDDDPIALPPSLQSLHVGIFGKTGAGKTTTTNSAILRNHAATDGASIVITPKGGGMATNYLRAHFATQDTLEDVLYFDCSTTLPAFTLFDIRDELDAGIPRSTAVENAAHHYAEMVGQIMGEDQYNSAVRSPKVIQYLIKALFDPVNGADAFTHSDLCAAVNLLEEGTHPPVADETDEDLLSDILKRDTNTFETVMGGIRTRIDQIRGDHRLRTIFNQLPDDDDDPHFDLVDYLDDVVIIVDTGGMADDAQRILTLALISNLWSSLKRRHRRSGGDNPLVNLYVDEAATVADSSMLDDLLSQSREFDCSVTLASQFPGQLRTAGDTIDDDGDILNNISTFVTGNVPIDRRLAQRLATDDMSPQDVSNRLRALRRGQWLVSLPAPFNAPEPRPFLLQSASPPPGDPAGQHPLSPAQEAAFADALADVEDRTEAAAGLAFTEPSGPTDDEPDAEDLRADSALPPTVTYQPAAHVLECVECQARFDPDIEGMRAAIDCCGALDRVDPADVPVCALNLKLAPAEQEASDYTTRQLLFLKAVYEAQLRRFDPLEYSLIADSMLRLQEYVGIDSDAIQELCADGRLTHNSDHPHKLYTVTSDGRSLIGERYRFGEEYGHLKGDLDETSEHVLGVVATKRFVQEQFRDAPDSAVATVRSYFDMEEEDDQPAMPMALAMGDPENGDLATAKDEFDRRRIDVVGLDEDGSIVVAAEVERVNHDVRRAAPADYDKMAACDPQEAIWVTPSHSDAHKVLSALNDPLEGEPRVEKAYSENTPAQLWNLDSPGCTKFMTLKQVLEEIDVDFERALHRNH